MRKTSRHRSWAGGDIAGSARRSRICACPRREFLTLRVATDPLCIGPALRIIRCFSHFFLEVSAHTILHDIAYIASRNPFGLEFRRRNSSLATSRRSSAPADHQKSCKVVHTRREDSPQRAAIKEREMRAINVDACIPLHQSRHAKRLPLRDLLRGEAIRVWDELGMAVRRVRHSKSANAFLALHQ